MGLFDFLKAKKKSEVKSVTKVKLLDGFAPIFSSLASRQESDIYVTARDSLVRHCSKLRIVAKSVDRESGLIVSDKNSAFSELFSLRPNPLLSASAFLQKAAYNYFEFNHCFIYLDFDRLGKLKGLWVLDNSAIDIYENPSGQLFMGFVIGGHERLIPYDDLVHIQRNVNYGKIFGNDNPLMTVLDVINTNDNGITAAIQASNFVKFILEYTTPLSEEAKKAKAEAFQKTWLKPLADDGAEKLAVIVSDVVGKITQVNNNSKYESPVEIKEMYKRVYAYLGTSEALVNNDYTEDQFQSVFESAIEPFAIKLEQELTYKCFSQNERTRGNRIAIEYDRLATMSLRSRLSAANVLVRLPIVRPNEVFKLLYLPESTEGAKYYSTLNYVQSDKQNQYQLGVDDNDFRIEENRD